MIIFLPYRRVSACILPCCVERSATKTRDRLLHHQHETLSAVKMPADQNLGLLGGQSVIRCRTVTWQGGSRDRCHDNDGKSAFATGVGEMEDGKCGNNNMASISANKRNCLWRSSNGDAIICLYFSQGELINRRLWTPSCLHLMNNKTRFQILKAVRVAA